MLREFFYTGIGAASLLRERVEEEVKKLEEKGKLGANDAKSLMESIEARGKEEDEKLKARLKELLKEAMDEIGIATKADIEALRKDLK